MIEGASVGGASVTVFVALRVKSSIFYFFPVISTHVILFFSSPSQDIGEIIPFLFINNLNWSTIS